MRWGGEDEDLVVVVEAADVGGHPDEADEAVLVLVEWPNLKYIISIMVKEHFKHEVQFPIWPISAFIAINFFEK